MKRSYYFIIPILMLTACSNFRYPEPDHATKEFYKAKVACQQLAEQGFRVAIGQVQIGQSQIEQRELFLNCMKGEGY